MINEIKFTVVTVDFEESKLITYKCNSLEELIQKLFFEGYYDIPEEMWIKYPIKYRKDILKEINYYIDEFAKSNIFNIFYIKDNEIEELSLDDISDDEYINAYLTYYE